MSCLRIHFLFYISISGERSWRGKVEPKLNSPFGVALFLRLLLVLGAVHYTQVSRAMQQKRH
jgi:hypothetical protein